MTFLIPVTLVQVEDPSREFPVDQFMQGHRSVRREVDLPALSLQVVLDVGRKVGIIFDEQDGEWWRTVHQMAVPGRAPAMRIIRTNT